MLEKYLSLLVCPVTRSAFRLQTIAVKTKIFNTGEKGIISEGILFADKDWFFPIIDGVPRLLIESFLDYEEFLNANGETKESLQEKLIFDAGCGNGQLNKYIAHCGATVVEMDLSKSVERAF